MTITITRSEPTSRRARHATIAALVVVGASLSSFLAVETLTDDPATTDTAPADADLSTQLADWARSNGVSGLSPASASAPAEADVSAQLADWARSNGVSGLSPAGASATTPAG